MERADPRLSKSSQISSKARNGHHTENVLKTEPAKKMKHFNETKKNQGRREHLKIRGRGGGGRSKNRTF